MNGTAKEWVDKAEGDFETATRELGAPSRPNYDAVCYHCQQCIEKLLKAVLVLHKSKPPRFHDLVVLSDLLHTVVPTWTAEQKGLRFLDSGVALSLHPGATPEKAATAFALCEQLRQDLKKLLSACDDSSPNATTVDTGKRCRKCGYNLTGLPDPVRCPECGRQNQELDTEWEHKDKQLGLYVMTVNVFALFFGIWGYFSPHPARGFFFGTGPDVVRICCIIPVQWALALCGLFMFLAWLSRDNDPARTPPWLAIGTLLPFLLAIPTCLKLR